MIKKEFKFDYCKNLKKYLIISAIILGFGLLYNIIFGVIVNIQFTGGAIVKYSFTGDLNADDAAKAVSDAIDVPVTASVNKNVVVANSSETVNFISISISDKDGVNPDDQSKMLSTLQEKYPDHNFAQMESNSVDPTMGTEFLLKCLIAVIVAFVLIILYIALRFRKIGGFSAGMFALVALIHDVLVVYFTFVIFRLSLDDNFIAVILTILGYSLNDTIVIYDRIRENRRTMGARTSMNELVNTSINQTFMRTLMTSVCTFIAVGVVTILAILYNIESILSFSLPMMVGIVSGFYSSVCLSGPLWVLWQNHKINRKEAKRALAKKK